MTSKMARSPERLPPIHPGEILNGKFLLPMDITQYRLAKAIRVDARRVHSIVHGQRSITAETALLFSRFFGNSAGFWMGLQSQYDLEAAEDCMSQRLEAVVSHSSGYVGSFREKGWAEFIALSQGRREPSIPSQASGLAELPGSVGTMPSEGSSQVH